MDSLMNGNESMVAIQLNSRLMFLFDCGGWQTEGWVGETKLGNLAGYLGFLDFRLSDGTGAIHRDHLNIHPEHYPKGWAIKARVSKRD